ncbi:helix-turn-helix domain-containing protein [Bifidobacterium panos]|uniref:IrrE N-terminal-like domain-containing protein n=1 Tax=Bifidobacterium panos TaxID=2675321 RepID=A0ABX1SWW5_9BIFI|nr:XRE family transcriptional regulator [Bifidobacterium sp. DSM 109963]NMN01393.1 IrrE N-terminal-like domain-containing protein [Bifidobacterium sp. DSM 109963]
MNEFNPERIELARQYRGWTKKELAERCDMTPTYIGRLIADSSAHLTESSIEKIAYATSLPLSFFMLRGNGMDWERLAFRRKKKITKNLDHRICAEFEMLADTISRVRSMSDVPDETASWLDEVAPTSDPQSQGVRRIAANTRAVLGLPATGAVRNVIRSAERKGVVIAPLTVEVNDAVSDGVTYPGKTLIGYFPENKPGDRLRFTIAHELGHLVLHRNRRPKDVSLMEREANEFAGEFLLPESDARSVLSSSMMLEDYRYVKSGWGISIAATVRRAFDLGLIDGDKYKSLYVRMAQRRWTKHEPVEVKVEHPVLFSQMLGRAFEGLDDSGHSTVPRAGLEGFLGVPFELANDWCDNGLTEKAENWMP